MWVLGFYMWHLSLTTKLSEFMKCNMIILKNSDFLRTMESGFRSFWKLFKYRDLLSNWSQRVFRKPPNLTASSATWKTESKIKFFYNCKHHFDINLCPTVPFIIDCRHCGSTSPGVITSSGNGIVVELVSDSTVSSTGFRATWKINEQRIPTTPVPTTPSKTTPGVCPGRSR